MCGRELRRALSRVAGACALLVLAGCATLHNGREWGRDATLRPGWRKLGSGLEKAARRPETWAPVGAALLLQVDHADRRLGSWAWDRTPVFGSVRNADRSSDRLLRATEWIYVASLIATPSGDQPRDWVVNKIKGGAIGLAAIEVNDGATDRLKTAAGRTRPDRSDDRSFPSGHASSAAVRSALASGNARAVFAGQRARMASRVACGALALGCGWARMEARKHYPSDVLAGLALGYFIGAVADEVFIGGDPAIQASIGFAPTSAGFAVRMSWGP